MGDFIQKKAGGNMSNSHDDSMLNPPTSVIEQDFSVERIDIFLDNPSKYFNFSLTQMMGLSRTHLDSLHIAGLKRRFDQFRGTLPMLDKLANSEEISAINQLDDVLPLLFGHEVYKSYPASFLENGQYSQLTAWLNKLTTIDLSKIDVSSCRSIDDWLTTLSRESPMVVVHTSGTSGTLSFLPSTKSDWSRYIEQFAVLYFQRFGQSEPGPKVPLNIDCIYPFFRYGALSHIAINQAASDAVAGDESRFHTAYPGRLSADLLLLAAKRRAAKAKGLPDVEISPELAARRDEFDAQQRDMPNHIANFFDTLRTKLAGKQVFLVSASNMLHSLAVDGLKQGMKRIFSPNSVIATGGGGKGSVLPEDWQETIKAFFGAENLFVVFGMTEMLGQFITCEHGHYHAVPWIIPFILDADTNQPLPRQGTATGRFAFYDLLADTRWGGFISGDQVTLDWDSACPCGRTTPFIVGKIQRLSEVRADIGEEKINCAAAPDDYAKALDFVSESVV